MSALIRIEDAGSFLSPSASSGCLFFRMSLIFCKEQGLLVVINTAPDYISCTKSRAIRLLMLQSYTVKGMYRIYHEKNGKNMLVKTE